MFDRRAALTLPALLATILGATWLLAGREELAPAAPTVVPEPGTRAPSSTGLRWILAGGGPTPELNQVQIEQDLDLARTLFEESGAGLVLYAGGPNAASVQVLSDTPNDDALRTRLAELFDPRGGRDSHYRDTQIAPDGAASAEAILSALGGAIVDGDLPLTLYLAGHGVGGEEPHHSRFLTWGPGDLTVEDLAETLDAAPRHRPVRIVMTACYAGGFAELAFTAADPEQGGATTDRCGFFATTWDRAAAGCDPNPDRRSQEGYGIHFLHALRGEARDGSDAMGAIDIDHDGVVSLLEAHQRARIASGSLDVPVTTSERFLRASVDDDDDAPEGLRPAALPEENAVVDSLSRRLGIREPAETLVRLEALLERIGELADRLDEIDTELDIAAGELAAALLHRWPVLDDPWHPDFQVTFAAEHDAIAAHLGTSALALRERELDADRERMAEEHDDLLVEAAPLERLARALETLDLAARLQAEGGRLWLRYLAFLACERGEL